MWDSIVAYSLFMTLVCLIGALVLHTQLNILLGYLTMVPFVFILIIELCKFIDELIGFKELRDSYTLNGLNRLQKPVKLTPQGALKIYKRFERYARKRHRFIIDAPCARDITIQIDETSQDLGDVLYTYIELAARKYGSMEATYIQGCMLQSGFNANPNIHEELKRFKENDHEALKRFKEVVTNLENRSHLSWSERKLLKKAKQREEALEENEYERENFSAQHNHDFIGDHELIGVLQSIQTIQPDVRDLDKFLEY